MFFKAKKAELIQIYFDNGGKESLSKIKRLTNKNLVAMIEELEKNNFEDS